MEKFTFWGYLESILKSKPIGWGLFFYFLGIVADIITVFQALPDWLKSLTHFAILPFTLIGTILLLIGVFRYTNFLYKKFESEKKNLPFGLAFSAQAETFFRDFRSILEQAIATKELEELKSQMKFLKFNTEEGGNPHMLLSIDKINKRLLKAQVECRKQVKTKIAKKSFTSDEFFGFLEITKIDENQKIIYCKMKTNEEKNWKDLYDGIKQGFERPAPINTIFRPSVQESLKSFSKSELKKFFSLVGKFNQY